MKFLITNIVLIFLFLISNLSYAQNSTTRISNDSLIRLSNTIQECKDKDSLLDLYRQNDSSSQDTIKKLEQESEVKDKIIEQQRLMISNYEKIEELRKQEKEIYENHIKFLLTTITVQNEVAQKALKDIRPSFWERITNISFGSILGAIATAILLH